MRFFTHELAIDLGTANTVIFNKGEIALDEPSIVAIDTKTGDLISEDPLKAVARGTCKAIEDTDKYKYKFLMR